jgi:hypothetical protein
MASIARWRCSNPGVSYEALHSGARDHERAQPFPFGSKTRSAPRSLRRAFSLPLYTGQRGGDVCRMTRGDIVDGRVRVVQDRVRKGTTNELLIPIHPALARALGGAYGGGCITLSRTPAANRSPALRPLCRWPHRAAGSLRSPWHPQGGHVPAGRKRSYHEADCRFSGHQSPTEIELYTARADQAGLAGSAIAKLPDRES